MQIVELLAELCHEINRAYCRGMGDDSQPKWKDASDDQKDSARAGVMAYLKSGLSPEQSHALWVEKKKQQGWKYGVFKDVENKLHPCMVPFAGLPREQKTKDYLFAAVVRTVSQQMNR